MVKHFVDAFCFAGIRRTKLFRVGQALRLGLGGKVSVRIRA